MLFGYTMSTPRNMLRFGIGVSKNQIRVRDVIPIGINNTEAVVLMEYKNWDTPFNATIQYDFFMTPQYSVGVRLSGMVGIASEHFSGMVAFGYALKKVQKQKIGV